MTIKTIQSILLAIIFSACSTSTSTIKNEIEDNITVDVPSKIINPNSTSMSTPKTNTTDQNQEDKGHTVFANYLFISIKDRKPLTDYHKITYFYNNGFQSEFLPQEQDCQLPVKAAITFSVHQDEVTISYIDQINGDSILSVLSRYPVQEDLENIIQLDIPGQNCKNIALVIFFSKTPRALGYRYAPDET